MANKKLKSLRFPGLNDSYVVPQKVSDLQVDIVDDALSTTSENALQNKVIAHELSTKAVNLDYDAENNLLYLLDSNNERIGDGVYVAGGGGGGGGVQYTITLTNLMVDRYITVAKGASVVLSFSYTSIDEEEIPDGDGIGTLLVNNVRVATFAVPQGTNNLDISNYLVTGQNNVTVRVSNSEGLSKSLPYVVTTVELKMSTTFNELDTYSGSVAFGYTLIGTGTKTVHFVMDGTEIGTAEVTTSGRSQTYNIPEQAAGSHIFTAYADITVGDVEVQSNVLKLGMLYIDSSLVSPSVLTTFDKATAIQGETLDIPYIVYNPVSETASVTLRVIDEDLEVYSEKNITVDRTSQVWSVSDYPAGDVQFVIVCGSATASVNVDVEEYVFPIEPITDSLLLEFDAIGRSNGEANPAQWHYGDYIASFDGFGWTGVDGWISDSDGAPVLRFLPGDEMVIPLKPFASDARDTGYTIDVELATRDVRNYESIVVSCIDNGRGFKIQSQEAMLASEQSNVAMLFKEDAKVRVTFSIEQRNLNRLIYIYINGVMCGVTQYPVNDNFVQVSPKNITIGSDSCGLDLHRIRIYNKGLTRAEQLDNYICDRATLAERRTLYEDNDVLDQSDEVVINKLPQGLPYMILTCAQLPQYKGDKKTGAEVTFVDRENTARSWEANGVELDVQGTSSAGYPVKNYKIKLKNGIRYTDSGNTEVGFPISVGEIPTKTLCFKADFASSENANNVVLAKYYNELCPYKDPAQVANPKVRQGIDGFGIALFWQDTATGNVKFIGKGNCNTDKSAEDVFGFSSAYPALESWEFKNNTSNRVLFKSADFSGSAWLDDFEARYPDTKPAYENPTRLSRVVGWVASTDRTAVDDQDEKAERLQKFIDEFDDYFIKDSLIFYYVFTEMFLMVDNRAKNMFLTTFDGTHWFTLPYDFDTAIGINNEGALVFSYNLEDTDKIGTADVFNGQDSVLWNNVRDAFADDIQAMYNTLRSGTKFSYPVIQEKFVDHQSVWPEAIWNEDAFIKYLQPYLIDGENYLSMLQGNKASQRDWWLFNAFRYRDSKYQTGDASNQFITLRCYAVGNITVTPYADIYVRVKYGSVTAMTRATRNIAYEMVNTLDQMNDTEVYVYSADRLASVGDLSHLKVGYANFSMATKLQNIKLGSSTLGYENTRLKEFYVGNNELLTSVDLTNCSALGTDTQKSIDLSGCVSITEVLLSGTALRGVDLPVGGHLETLRLPATITNLTIRNQQLLSTLVFDGYGSLETLRIENTPDINISELVRENSETINRVRLIGIDWEEQNADDLMDTIAILDDCIGMDAAGNNTDHAVVTGVVRVPSITSEQLQQINDAFPELVVIVNGVAQYVVRYLNLDGSVLYRYVISEGGTCIDPVASGTIPTPTMPAVDGVGYTYRGWDNLPSNVHNNVTIVAEYDTVYAIYCMNGSALYDTQWVSYGGNGTAPTNPSKAATAQYTYAFQGWSKSSEATTVDADAFNNITAPRTLYAVYTETLRTYTVRWYNGSTLLETDSNVPYGGTATYDGATPTPPTDFRFKGFEPDGTNIQGDTNCYAQFVDTRSPLTKYLAGTMTDYVSGPDATKVAQYAFYREANLQTVDTTATTVEQYAFKECANLESVTTNGTSGVNIGQYAFQSCSKLELVDLKNTGANTIGANAFANVASLAHLIIRSETVSVLSATSALTGTKIASGTGAIYVPSELVDSYKVATNWSTYAAQIYPISAYPKTDFSTISDSWAEINANANYATDYVVGDTKLLDLGTKGKFYMELVALDTDDLADNSGKARMTWISKGIIENQKMNATKKTVDGSTAYTAGGWLYTDMRSYLRETILPLLPEVLQNNIKEVAKTYRTKSPTDTTLSTTDTLWIPSCKEVGFTDTSYVESEGVVYSDVFKSNAARIKYNASGSAGYWWLRSASDTSNFRVVVSNGNENSRIVNGSNGLVLGFCL